MSVRGVVLRRAGILALLLPLTACAAASTPAPGGTSAAKGWYGTRLAEPYAKPTTAFTTPMGSSYRIDRDARRAVVLLVFGYTHCPDVCSRVLSDIAGALRDLDPGTRDRVQVLFVTVDPTRDTDAALQKYLVRFDPTFLGLRAPLADVRQAANSVGVAVAKPVPTKSGYTVGHGAQIVGFGPDGLSHLIWMPGTPAADLCADVVRLASSS